MFNPFSAYNQFIWSYFHFNWGWIVGLILVGVWLVVQTFLWAADLWPEEWTDWDDTPDGEMAKALYTLAGAIFAFFFPVLIYAFAVVGIIGGTIYAGLRFKRSNEGKKDAKKLAIKKETVLNAKANVLSVHQFGFDNNGTHMNIQEAFVLYGRTILGDDFRYPQLDRMLEACGIETSDSEVVG